MPSTELPGPAISPTCPDCGCEIGALHTPGCDIEQCPQTGQQGISSDVPVTRARLPWRGLLPGVAECHEFNLWAVFSPQEGWTACDATTPGAVADLNRLYGSGDYVWDADAARFVSRAQAQPG